ncbi:hydantoinase/oxoprolinase family protein [Amycolatopsis jejuensis]|uniref:hydantoinase/oxoprolinase family protein n=1 Tax=Amycolatopsis jejuensis TaxID=330084 RepID=UPI00052551CC|nr:hydantoinase/oxoprolinase family protein [Amycolatopsis jejuensis]
MATRMGVDVGGTFTDLVFYDGDTGEVRIAKGPSTSDAPDRGVLHVVGDTLDPDAIARTRYFLHGSTVALNALLERKGVTVGLLSTAGFRDTLELRRGDRARMTDYRWRPPEPLVPRQLRFDVRERMLVDGTAATPLGLGDVDAAFAACTAAGVEVIAVVYLNAYANPEHEVATGERLRALGFTGDIVLSHAISREFKEYERTSTTVVDASIRPIMAGYLKRLSAGLRDLGMAGEALITNSGGGAMSFTEGETRSYLTIQSGPVAGAVATAELCAQLGFPRGIAADVGGTSFDTCLVADGKPAMTYETHIAGMPLQAPFVDVRSIGAGGGSLAYRDAGGLLRVGPRSAGAQPGPACYGRGGTEPTVTDAAATLGLLAAGSLAGNLDLDVAAAERAVGKLANEMGMSTADTARGIITIANAAMANAVREMSLQRGHDPREHVLVAFGGAGPLFGSLIADELGCSHVLVPVHAGNFSAWGLLGQDRVYAASQTIVTRLDEHGMPVLRSTLDGLTDRLSGQGTGDETVITERLVDARYVGQEHSLTVPFPDTGDPAVVRAAFDNAYATAFGHSLDDPVETVAVRQVRRCLLPPRIPGAHAVTGGPRPGTADAFSFHRNENIEFAVVARNTLAPGERLAGPAIVTEETATTYLDAGHHAEIHPDGTMVITHDLD